MIDQIIPIDAGKTMPAPPPAAPVGAINNAMINDESIFLKRVNLLQIFLTIKMTNKIYTTIAPNTYTQNIIISPTMKYRKAAIKRLRFNKLYYFLFAFFSLLIVLLNLFSNLFNFIG